MSDPEAEAKLAAQLFDYDNIRRRSADEQKRKQARLEKATLLSDKHKLEHKVKKLEADVRQLRVETKDLKIENARMCYACDLLHCELQALKSPDVIVNNESTSCTSSRV